MRNLILQTCLAGAFICSPLFALSLAENELAETAAVDLKPAIDRLSLKTVAFWKLINNDAIPLDPVRFGDKLEIGLLKNGNCDVVDRNVLQRIYVEMKLSALGSLNTETIKQIGKLYCVGGFIYAETFNDYSAGKMKNQVLIVKLINTETGELMFCRIYRLDDTAFETSYDIALWAGEG